MSAVVRAMKEDEAEIELLKKALVDALCKVDELSNYERLDWTEAVRKKCGLKTVAQMEEEYMALLNKTEPQR